MSDKAMLAVLPWRAVFVIFGAVGFVWAAVWYWWFRDEPEMRSAVSQQELDHIRQGRCAGGSLIRAGRYWPKNLTTC